MDTITDFFTRIRVIVLDFQKKEGEARNYWFNMFLEGFLTRDIK